MESSMSMARCCCLHLKHHNSTQPSFLKVSIAVCVKLLIPDWQYKFTDFKSFYRIIRGFRKMKNLCFIVYLMALLTASSSRGYPRRYWRAGRPSTEGQMPGSKCRTKTGRIGICVKFSECQIRDRHRSEAPCLWKGNQPFTCCLSVARKIDPTSFSSVSIMPKYRLPGCGSRPIRYGPASNRRGRSVHKTLEENPFMVDDFKIIGGSEAAAYSWPWMAAIVRTTGSRRRFICAASLISSQHILTAAHCFRQGSRINPRDYFVMLGAHESNSGTAFPIEKISVHENYQPTEYYDDIAVITLRYKIPFDTRIHPVCLPRPDLDHEILDGRQVTLTGWGDTAFGGVSSRVLHEVSFPVVPLNACNSAYSALNSSTLPLGITERFLCAGVDDGTKDACQGDSGGPLVLNESVNSWTQVGIVSFGYKCGVEGYPGVYTKVSKYLKWIEKHMDL